MSTLTDSRRGHGMSDAHYRAAPAGQSSEPARYPTNTQLRIAGSELISLNLAADVVDDMETVRIANGNRLSAIERMYLAAANTPEEKAEAQLAFKMDPDAIRLAAIIEAIHTVEKLAIRNLEKSVRDHPLYPWIKAQKGIGDKTAARLLAVIGDPYVGKNGPRTVSQLWAYCGHGDPARRKAKGMTQADLFALGNPLAKKRVWLIATTILKAQGPLSAVYYDRKAATEGREHAIECKRCGPSGKPAQPGSPWSDAHRHADALRVLGKAVLRELWTESKKLHDDRDQSEHDTQAYAAPVVVNLDPPTGAIVVPTPNDDPHRLVSA